MITLVKAQVFINILSGLSFRSILKSLQVQPFIRLLAIIVFIISFSFFNFWPWYNHTVIVYQLTGLAFLFRYLIPKESKSSAFWLILSALFLFLSFFTKQDGGGLGLLICLALLLYQCILNKKYKAILIFTGSYIAIGALFIVPASAYNFGYWFNHGQPPHTSRLSVADFLAKLLGGSQWIKFYALLMVILLLPLFKNFKEALQNQRLVLFALLTFGILAEAAVFQFTSYTPPDNNIFYHSFAFAFIVTLLSELNIFAAYNFKHVTILAVLVALWWSEMFWKYIDRKVQLMVGNELTVSPTGENIVNEKTYIINTDTSRVNIPQAQWVQTDIPVFKKLTMPASAAEGLKRTINNPRITSKVANNRILNMTEFTPLGYIMGFQYERGSHYPLWNHLGVGMFNKQKDMFCQRISQKYYDVVLYEYIPVLNNFYPFEIRDSLKKNYELIDSFLAPRSPTYGYIEVYAKPQ
ncbi:hypothetical protein [Foetidibacter luteolus]|uniref:hypothetical protein n=1 Tax=Foetidibacter luteolus TaxID=2608880 RepID=UPI00129BFC36|nr:hypothetical protein [Foetidibacter luteolus]